MLLGKRRVGLAPSSLFDGQEAGAFPDQTWSVLIEEGLKLMPGDGAQDMVPRLVQAYHMARGVGATVGNHQQRRGLNILLQERKLLGGGGVAVDVATESITEEWHSAEVVDDGKQTGVDHLGIGGDIAMGKVGGRKVSGGG